MWIALAVLLLGLAAVPTAMIGCVVFEVFRENSEMEQIRQNTPERVSRGNWRALTEEGERLVAALQAHHENTGSYPATLAELHDPPEGWADWTYGSTDGDEFSLSIGHYQALQIVVFWNPLTGAMATDT